EKCHTCAGPSSLKGGWQPAVIQLSRPRASPPAGAVTRMSNVIHILYADGLKRGRVLLKRFLAPAHGDFRVTEVGCLNELREALRTRTCDVVLADLDLPGCTDLDLIEAVQAAHPGLPLVVLTSDTDRALGAMQRGVADCLSKTAQQLARLPHILRRALERQRLEREQHQVEERLRTG